MDDKVDTHKANGTERVANGKWTPILIAVISAALGSSGGIALVFNTPFGEGLARPDPWTATQADARYKQTNARLNNLEYHVKEHPDAELRRVISDLRAEMAGFEATQRIISRTKTAFWIN